MKPTPLIESKGKSCTVKYIDDASKACAIDLKKSLIDLEVSCRPRPLDFHEHTGFTLDSESNELQEELNNLKIFTDSNLMTINEKKTQIMCFNFRKSLRFPPIYRIGNGQQLEIVKKTKIPGVILSDDLWWTEQVEYMCTRALKKIWLLRRLRMFILDQNILLDFYCKEIRSILEYCAPCWNSGLTIKLSKQIERVQKISTSIILCDNNHEIPYQIRCTILGIEPLYIRRLDLCIRFSQKTAKNTHHCDMFTPSETNRITRNLKLKYREFNCHTKRFYDSPLCYLTRILNQHLPES